MTKYNFDKLVHRRHTGSVKWDEIPEEALPFWVADMDFEVAPAIREALAKRVEHGVFGYTQVDDSYYEALISWFSRRHQWTIQREWVIYTIGVVPAISCTVKALTLPGEKVLIQTPVYNCFFSSIRNQGCDIAENELVRTGDTYTIDWDDFEAKCADEKTTVFLLCNPHNPVGRVWTRDELARMGEICAKHHVRVVSDEIHCELVMPGFTFTPFASVNDVNQDNCVVFNSPSKSFNIAGLQIANIICKDVEMRRRIDRVVNIYEVCDVNPFGPIALKAAYNESEDWLDELNLYIADNYKYLKEYLAEHLPKIEVVKLEGTYLAWADISKLGMTSGEAARRLLEEGKVFFTDGTAYGKKAGEGYLRINLACTRALLKEGLQRMEKVLGDHAS
ncbi:MAG: MalY/PatB family protein [Prevotella sp.]|jgi:cystathionine beta-lyase